jgi:hypothetical protein
VGFIQEKKDLKSYVSQIRIRKIFLNNRIYVKMSQASSEFEIEKDYKEICIKCAGTFDFGKEGSNCFLCYLLNILCVFNKQH